MAESLENIIEEKRRQPDKDDLQAKIESKEGKNSLLRTIWRVALTAGAILGTFGIVGFNSIYTTIGNGIGYLVEIKRKKGKFKLKNFLKELYTGAIMGVVGTAIYTGIDIVPIEKIISPLKNIASKYYNIVRKVAKTLAFNPGLLIPYLAFYKGFTYLRDKVGFKRTIFPKKGEKPLTDMYQKGIKPDFLNGIGKLFKLFPIHYVNVNYITHVPTRIIIGVINDILFRLFQKKEAPKPVEYQKSDRYKTPQQYQPYMQPNYF